MTHRSFFRWAAGHGALLLAVLAELELADTAHRSASRLESFIKSIAVLKGRAAAHNTSQSQYSPEGDLICTSVDSCRQWDPDAWEHETNECTSTVMYSGPGLGDTPKTITVFYDDELDGGGIEMAAGFVKAVQDYLQSKGGLERRGEGQPPFIRGYEWCTGPGYIAFAHLAAGLVGRLFLSDINPRAVRCLHKTVRHNGLEKLVEVHLSKDFLHLPVPHAEEDKLDLVWGNPPNYLAIDPESSYRKNLRPADPGWLTHHAFYGGIRPYLQKGAALFIEEVMPESTQVTYKDVRAPSPKGGNYDTRPEPPLEVFRRMASEQGLVEVGYEDLPLDPFGANLSKLLIFQNPFEAATLWEHATETGVQYSSVESHNTVEEIEGQ